MKKLTLKGKILLGVAFVVVLSALVGYINTKETQSIKQTVYENSERFKELNELLSLKHAVTKLNLIYMDAIVDAGSRSIDDDIQKEHKEFVTFYEQKKKHFETSPYFSNDQNRITKIFDSIKKLYEGGDQLLKEIPVSKDQNFDAFDDVIDGNSDVAQTIIGEIASEVEESFRDNTTKLENDTNNAIIILYWLISVSILFIVIAGYMFSNYIVKQIEVTVNSLTKEIKHLFENSNAIDHINSNLTEITSNQSSALIQTSSSVNEITAMVNRNNDLTKESENNALNSTKMIHEGKITVKKLLSVMDSIHESNEQIIDTTNKNAEEMNQITKIINDISSKTKIINDIVFQTKILSFNASVEAARAGEAGKGFSVVAEEIGNLASISGEAASDITKMLEESTTKVHEITSESKDRITGITEISKQRINEGMEVSKACRNVFVEISSSVETVASSLQKISEASLEQLKGTEEISKAIDQISNGSQRVSKLSQKSATNSEKLKHGAEDLHSVASSLQLLISNENKKAS